MTGFGRAETKSAHGGSIRVEIKTVNHKFVEISSRLPGHLMEFEDTIRKMVGAHLKRGKVSLFVQSPDPASYTTRLVLNENLAKEVHHKIVRLKAVLKISEKLNDAVVLREVLHYPDVLSKDSSQNSRAVLFHEVEKAIKLALENLKKSRLQEGASLKKDFLRRLSEMDKALKKIEKAIPIAAKAYRKNLETRMKDFIKDGEIQKDRLTQDVAQFLKSGDISEEVTRFRTHIDAMKKTLSENGEIGRKIDFIGQEMTREANTMGAKSSDTVIAGAVIEIKSTIEKVREQSQNVE